MRTFFINLEHDVARRANIEAQLAGVGLEGERIAALTPLDLDPDLVARACDTAAPRHQTPAELACLMSHRRAWQAMLDHGLPHALFLEDDVLISSRLNEGLVHVTAALAPLDVVRVETNEPGTRLFSSTATRAGPVTLYRLRSPDWGCGGYILTRRGAEKLLGPLSRYDIPVDHAIYDYHFDTARHLCTRQTVPALIANGPAIERLGGPDFPSNLQAARLTRHGPTPRPADSLTRHLVRTYARARLGLGHFLDRTFRGVIQLDIPLL